MRNGRRNLSLRIEVPLEGLGLYRVEVPMYGRACTGLCLSSNPRTPNLAEPQIETPNPEPQTQTELPSSSIKGKYANLPPQANPRT